jgi:hypothetical protein
MVIALSFAVRGEKPSKRKMVVAAGVEPAVSVMS